MTSSIPDELYRTIELKKQLNACHSASFMREGNVCEKMEKKQTMQ